MSPQTSTANMKRKSLDIFSELTKSLLSRQLLSSFIITILGLTILSSLYYYKQQRTYLESAHANANALEDAIMGDLIYNDETHRHYAAKDPEQLQFLESILNSHHLTTNNDDHFAYIFNKKTGEITWHSQFFREANASDASKPPYPTEYLTALPTFKPKKPLKMGQNSLEISHPSYLSNFKGGRNTLNSKYLVYYSVFSETPAEFYFVVAKSSKEMDNTKSNLLRDISILILITSILVLVAQLVNTYLVIKPIKRFEREIKDIESGNQEFVTASYPTELIEVKGAINALVHVEKGQKKRYREALDNLAHSLKTPLAVLQGAAENNDSMSEKQRSTLVNQVTRMNDIIAYQLRRAVVSDHNANIKRQDIRPILYRLKAPLLKVHHSKTFDIEINVDENTKCRLDSDDLMEVFGNLIDNACRFCEKTVSITATNNGDLIIVDIDDDGLGFPDKNPSSLLKRGMRADNKTEGQGIGLAISNEIIEAAGGKVELLVSPHVGARVRLHLPV